jgi:hypothetical protein
MAERNRQRTRVEGIDPAMKAFKKSAPENTAALTAQQRRDRKRAELQVKLDLSCPERKAALEMIARQEKTSVSQAGNLLLAWAMTAYFLGEEKIHDAFYEGHEFSRSPRFEWNIQEPESWARILDDFETYGDVEGDV